MSISHSVAPDKKKRVNSLEFLFDSGSDFNFSSKFDHSSIENANKQPSKPFVTTNLSPIASLSLAGIINLPLASNECSNSPINMLHILPGGSPLSTTSLHLRINFNI